MKREDTKTKVNDPMSTVPTDKKLNVTPGECTTTNRWSDVMVTVGNKVVAEFGRAFNDEAWPEILANAALYKDAHNTYNKTFLLPSELAEQLEEARGIMKALQSVRAWAQANTDSPVSARIQYDHVAQDAWAFLSRTSPTDPTPPEK